MATESTARTNPFSGLLDMLGLPRLDEIIPTPASIAEITGIPTISDIIKQE